mmetsp:Transcript_13469/g.31673  ORF Transcript_13469/g.31673 Transcript_13469/m.31673 type:complete len:293 (+) Transcript_13469:127-1005(+)
MGGRISIDNCYVPGLGTFVEEETTDRPQGQRLQESDLLERRPQGENDGDPETNAIRLVSLGCYCGVKSSFQRIGRGSEHLPFDWMRTSLRGLEHFIKTDFLGFFDFVPPAKPIKAPPGKNMRMVLYRNFEHSFWHDDPTDPSMQEKYHRRIERFRSIDAHDSRVLFVRAAVHPGEIDESPAFLSLLQQRFGPQSCLLLILLRQTRLKGPAQILGLPNLLVWYHDTEGQPAAASFTDAVQGGLNWCAGRETLTMKLKSPQEAIAWADHYAAIYAYGHYVFQGLGVDGMPPKVG